MNRRFVITASSVAFGLITVYVALSAYTPIGLMAATVSVRMGDACWDGGLHRYERIAVPVDVKSLDGGIDATLPPALANAEACVHVMDWSTASLVPCSQDPATCALWDAGVPFRKAPQRLCLRAHFDAGLPCPLKDGSSFGDLNVTPRTARLDPAQCEEVECVVNAGEDPETSL